MAGAPVEAAEGVGVEAVGVEDLVVLEAVRTVLVEVEAVAVQGIVSVAEVDEIVLVAVIGVIMEEAVVAESGRKLHDKFAQHLCLFYSCNVLFLCHNR